MKRATSEVAFEAARSCALRLPEVEEGTSYGTPAFRVRKKLFARLREDGETLALRVDFDERETLMGADPQTFFITEHYRDYPMVLVRLAKVGLDELRDLLEQSWRRCAPPRLVAAYDRDAAETPPANPSSRAKTKSGGRNASASPRVDRPRRRTHRP